MANINEQVEVHCDCEGKPEKVIPRCLCGVRLIGKFKDLGMCSTCDKAWVQVKHSTIYKDLETAYKDLMSKYILVSKDLTKLSQINAEMDCEIRVINKFKDDYVAQGVELVRVRTELEDMREELEKERDRVIELESELADVQHDYNSFIKYTESLVRYHNAFEALPEVKSQKICTDLTCAICLNNVVKDEYVRHINCEHVYHNICLYKHMRTSNSCPMCRAIITPSTKVISDDESECGDDCTEAIIEDGVSNDNGGVGGNNGGRRRGGGRRRKRRVERRN